MKKKIDCTIERNGTPEKVCVVVPKADDLNRGDVERNVAFGRYLKKGVPLKTKLWEWAKGQGLWDDAKAEELSKIDEELMADLALLPDGSGRVHKSGLKATDLRDAAIRIRVNRNRRVRLLEPVNALDAQTAEGMAEEDKFRAVLVRCVLDAAGRPYFASVEEYLERANEPDVEEAARHFGVLYFNIDDDYHREFPENKFLASRKMCDESLHLIGRDGKRCDAKGNPIPDEAPVESAESFDLEDDWSAPVPEKKPEEAEAPAEPTEPVADEPKTIEPAGESATEAEAEPVAG